MNSLDLSILQARLGPYPISLFHTHRPIVPYFPYEAHKSHNSKNNTKTLLLFPLCKVLSRNVKYGDEYFSNKYKMEMEMKI